MQLYFFHCRVLCCTSLHFIRASSLNLRRVFKLIFSLLFVLVVGLELAGCRKTETIELPTSSSPISIVTWTATPSVIRAGETSVLHWQVVNAQNINIHGHAQDLPLQGEFKLTPTITTSYELIAHNRSGETQTAQITIEVLQSSSESRTYPILFVTQTPLAEDKNGRLSAFANHMTQPAKVPRGGDLMLRYPDGSLRNLTRELGYGNEGLQAEKSIAVREPSVHWSGEKALFSMLIGAPSEGESRPQQLEHSKWQIYEISGLNPQAQKPSDHRQPLHIQKLAGQDSRYNNLSPFYGSDDSILFSSDRPRDGSAHLYPQLDEYEATPSITGIWKIDLKTQLHLLNHTPSGAFNPFIDSFGRIIFTRWDHLQQDQLADRDRDTSYNQVALPFRSFNYASEASDAKKIADRAEFFPESRVGQTSIFGRVSAFRSNFFTAWQMNQDGSSEETLNHFGLHELVFGYLTPSFMDDPHLRNQTRDEFHRNQLSIRREGGLFHISEDPQKAGLYYAINARESGSFTTDTIVRFQADPGVNPEQVSLTAVTSPTKTDNLPEGRYRNPIALSDGRLVASHTSIHLPPEIEQSLPELRLRFLRFDPSKKYSVPGDYLSKGIRKKLSWWDGKQIQNYQGNLWELEAVEVRPRRIPLRASTPLETPERAVLHEENVDERVLRQWLKDQQLALIVTRDQTSRDRADLQQPFNLRVPGGKQSIAQHTPDAKLYDISAFQIVEARQVRAYEDRPGRRNLAQPIENFSSINQKAKTLPSSVVIAADGSTAALVPAGRALSWQTTDAKGNPVVRERNWVTFQAGEIRTCAACHGVNTQNQAGFAPPLNKPEALRTLLQSWKKSIKTDQVLSK